MTSFFTPFDDLDDLILPTCVKLASSHLNSRWALPINSLDGFMRNVSNISVLRRMLFAASYLPTDMPKYWEAIKDFSKVEWSICELKTAVENLRSLHGAALATDEQLMDEVHAGSIGVVLVSAKQNCGNCGAKLNARADRPRKLVLYTQSSGTLLATHYRKVCSRARSGCSFVQHYGYSTNGRIN